MRFPLLPRCHTAGPTAGKPANCSMCAKPQGHADFYTNTSIIFAVIVKVVDMLVICLYSRKYIYFNSFKTPSGRVRQMKWGKQYSLTCGVLLIQANGTLLLEASHAVACQC